MAEQLTLQQKIAVENRGGKLLVSAAAGSGKTKVLVDRLLLYLTEGKGTINIDDFLIITYTKAAASELRVKIAAKLNEKLAEEPGNKHLQRQIQRLYLTKISTVHGFCTDILREYAYMLDIPGDFRVADEQECQLLQLKVLDKMMEQAYAEGDEDFYVFMDSQELGRDDYSIPQIILQVYNSAKCHVDPDQWLDQCLSDSSGGDSGGAENTVWGRYLIDDLHRYLDLQIDTLTKCQKLAQQNGTMDKPAVLLQATLDQLTALRNMNTWDEIVANSKIDYGRLVFPKNCTDLELAERIKAIRSACKDGLDKKLLTFADQSSRVLQDLRSCSQATQGLVQLVRRFGGAYDSAKKVRKILDFSDLEHKTLDLLLGKKRQGITALAHEIGTRFQEIMVDEYQDSNAVQDRIFEALTAKRQNCFMVGDVKQSIYQFRLADPGIFLEKYHQYVPAEEAKPGQERKVILSSNFRSAGPVIHAVNDVFSCCMSPLVGGLHYGPEEALSEGIPHVCVPEPEVEFTVINVQEDTYAEEAAYIANRIVELLDGTHKIRQGDTLRSILPEDIVIILRSPNSVGAEFQLALEKKGIHVNFGNGVDLLETEEIGFIRSMLQVIDNPLQDIPLVAVLSSRVFRFTADELSVIRSSGSKRKSFYESLCRSDLEKARAFIQVLASLRNDAMHCTLSRLVDMIYMRLKVDIIFSSFEDGDIRLANLQAFSRLAAESEASNYKELGRFLDYLDSMEEKGISVTADHGVSGAVTIMSIHKSKGLEFPVVFLCGLSRAFNREDVRAQVLCHKDLGIGLNCVDMKNRIRYPSIAKKAIASKMISDSLSEEMRVLYVATTRARDRLIMTFAQKNPEKYVESIANRMDYSAPELVTSSANCPGTWILMAALGRIESGPLFSLGSKPENVSVHEPYWKVTVDSVNETGAFEMIDNSIIEKSLLPEDIQKISTSLSFSYPHRSATGFPSKQTATQLKGRHKDQEAAENTEPVKPAYYHWRKPSFVHADLTQGAAFGNAVHSIMQHIDFSRCDDLDAVIQEIQRIQEMGLINDQAAAAVDPKMILSFFESEMGMKVRNASHVLREFKFSILDDAEKYSASILNDRILLQGVIDCAVIEDDGIIVLDFKTDHVTEDTISEISEQYRQQVIAYAGAISRIYRKKVLSAQLYFFRMNRFVTVI